MSRRDHRWPLTFRRFTSVVVVLDEADLSWSAFDAALDLCRETGAQITVLTVGGRPGQRSALGLGSRRRKPARTQSGALEHAEVFASIASVDLISRRTCPRSWKTIAEDIASHQHDLAVLGLTRSILRGHVLASTADLIAARVPCPVMIISAANERNRDSFGVVS